MSAALVNATLISISAVALELGSGSELSAALRFWSNVMHSHTASVTQLKLREHAHRDYQHQDGKTPTVRNQRIDPCHVNLMHNQRHHPRKS
jgi:hypothetical protein